MSIKSFCPQNRVPPPRKGVNFEDFILICAVFSSFWDLFGGGRGKTKFCRQEFYGHPDFSDSNCRLLSPEKFFKVSILRILYWFVQFFLILGPFRGGGGVKPNFADKNFMDTQTFLTQTADCHGHLFLHPFPSCHGPSCPILQTSCLIWCIGRVVCVMASRIALSVRFPNCGMKLFGCFLPVSWSPPFCSKQGWLDLSHHTWYLIHTSWIFCWPFLALNDRIDAQEHLAACATL